ncbi:MAG: GGDEF domain-containing protein [Pseudomonadota bacterium]
MVTHKPTQHATAWTLRKLKLSESLGQTLDIKEIVSRFYDDVRRDVPMSGLRFVRPELSMDFSFGNPGQHRADFSVRLGGQLLGTLTLSRSSPFSPEEARHVRNLLPCVAHPLRNAGHYQKALRSAFQDPLTQVMNRASLEQALPREISLAQRHRASLSLLVIDLDHFKTINDTHGHLVGDSILVKIANTIRSCLRSTDLVYRYGGDEFVVCLPSTRLGAAVDVAERIRASVSRLQSEIDGLTLSVTIGATEVGENCVLETLFERADTALYEAKRRGRNCVECVAAPQPARLREGVTA